MLARENHRLAQSIDEQYGETERLADVRPAAGDLAAVEITRIRTSRLPAKQALIDSQTAYLQGVRDLLNLLNTRSGQRIPELASLYTAAPAGFLGSVPVLIVGSFSGRTVAESLAELHERALSSRPDLSAARSNLVQAQIAARLAEAQRYRDVGVGVEYQRVGNDHSLGMIAEVPLLSYTISSQA